MRPTGVRSRLAAAVLTACAVVAVAGPLRAQCVGDCGGDDQVSISDLITGVNIALGLQPVSACEAFANSQGEVTIAQLITGVNNALNGCPPPADTPTATVTEAPPTATSTATATASATATATGTTAPSATFTATLVPSATPTGMPTGTATATATATGVPTGTATATATATSSMVPASATATATATGVPTGTATATATATGVPTGTASATLTPTPTASPSPTVAVPPGESAAGRAAIVSTGLGSVQALVGAIVSIITNDGNNLTVGSDDGLGGIGGAPELDDCPLGGFTSQDCTGPNGGPLTISLGANNCIAGGPLGGQVEFNGLITLMANAGLFVQCGDPPLFFGGTFAIDDLGIRFRGPLEEPVLDVAADLTGTFSLTPALSSCLVGSLTLTLNGTLTSVLGDGGGVSVQFQNTSVVIDQITFNADCVPINYRLTFNGPATFTPMQAGLFEAWSPLIAGGAPTDSFEVTFATFRVVQNATANPVIVTMSGDMTSDCFGGTIGLSTFTPLAVAAGELCPASGVLDVTGGGTTARVTYEDGAVTVDPATGPPEVYPTCLDPALLVCPA